MHAQVAVDGATVSWKLQSAPWQRVADVLRENGYGFAVPPVTTDRGALQAALGHLKGKNEIVKPLQSAAKDGYAVAQIVKGRSENEYPHRYSAKVTDGLVEWVNGWDNTPVASYELQDKWAECKATVGGGAIGQALRLVAQSMHAVKMDGALWIPPAKLNNWKALRDAIEGINGRSAENRFSTLTTKMDEDTLVSVKDALIEEVDRELARIKGEIDKGRSNGDGEHVPLTDKATLERSTQLSAVAAKVKHYKDVLQVSLVDITERVEKAQAETLMTMLATIG